MILFIKNAGNVFGRNIPLPPESDAGGFSA